MVQPHFTFDKTVNAYLSETFQLDRNATVRINLQSKAPVVTLKQDADGEWQNNGQTPKDNDSYEIRLQSNEEVTLRLATPVPVLNCYIF